MLISFSIANYRSIKEKLTLNMLPVKGFKELPDNLILINDKTKLLRSAVIYGANASGKSNLLKGLMNFIYFIKTSSSKTINDPVEIYDPFLLDKKSAKEPALFEIEFLLKNIRYQYSVTFDNKNIITEKLIFYPKGQAALIFDRKNIREFKYGTILKGEKKSIEYRLLNNQLYLSKAANENLNILIDVYKYFYQFEFDFTSIGNFSEILRLGAYIGTMLKSKNKEYLNRFEKIILNLDFGIHALKLRKNPNSKSWDSILPREFTKFLDSNKLPENTIELDYELITVHKVHNKLTGKTEYIEFPVERESTGTINLFTMAINILESFENGMPMIIDEFEKNIHPNIARNLINLFHDPELNINNAQLIFSTHAINLLDNSLFRRDQIWFTEKNEYGETDLYSLSQFEGIRKDMPLDKWYLSGRFGATPILFEPDITF